MRHEHHERVGVLQVADAVDLGHSDTAVEQSMTKAGSILDWNIRGDDYVADGYRIRLLQPRRWEISHEGAVIAYHFSRKEAFGIVEDHYRDTIRRRDLIRLGFTFVLAILAWIALGSMMEELWVVGLPFVFYVALSSFIRFLAVFSRNASDPYRRRLPWEKRPRPDQLFFGRR